jgi:2-polyprenyl-3-methyl-5-hydroxy-6-metoxy-1,4-benzoquinol methylase
MKANFLGKSKKKFTCNSQWDYCIFIEELKGWPHHLSINNQPNGGMWFAPYDGKNWAIFNIPTSMTSLNAYFGGYENPDMYQDLYDETEPAFEVIVTYSDGTQEKAITIDGRKKLTPEEEVDYLKAKTDWPQAVNPALIADDTSETDKLERAEGILDHFADFNLQQMKFLDFGCGEGHVAKKAIDNKVLLSVGYDPKTTQLSQDKLILTPDFNQVIENGPYDFIAIYDVLDHAENEEPLALLEKIKSVSKANTIIKIRCHPWIARHGGHQYKKLNKAFAHLILNEKELEPTMHCIKLNNPLQAYNEWFLKVGFKVKSEEVVRESVESFFKLGIVKRRIMENQGMKLEDINNLDCSFVDYELVLL